MNLVTSKPASDMALGAPAPGGRMLTLVPWRGRAIVGTSQSATLVQPGDTAVTDAELNAFIADANHAFPALKLSRADITLVHRGVVPAVQTAGGPELKPSPEILDHASDGAAGAITVVGVKYTTARALAERVDARRRHAASASVCGRRGPRRRRCQGRGLRTTKRWPSRPRATCGSRWRCR